MVLLYTETFSELKTNSKSTYLLLPVMADGSYQGLLIKKYSLSKLLNPQ